ncbi:proposed F420-0 ABC transporter, periplasmic F420-0 binding protein [Leclercia adecarboxylata]|uniref:Proposed F420-0 ABC transporter, periplasmic F420-0 binding protein n=1 Tax=Leclercia adecarboxylata TaxID=83655 RepID=A0A4U9HUA4_9ENTR|nr:proposed F420-0 ABC transporter, periplasmic F420-0 binding protein [Leclercia adecarboxylata]
MLIKKLVLASVLATLANSVIAAQVYPLTVENCGIKETFNRAPQRVVTVGQHETELLLALGLEKKNQCHVGLVWSTTGCGSGTR